MEYSEGKRKGGDEGAEENQRGRRGVHREMWRERKHTHTRTVDTHTHTLTHTAPKEVTDS